MKNLVKLFFYTVCLDLSVRIFRVDTMLFNLQEIQKAFDAESTESGLPKLLLAAGVSAVKSVIDSAYEVEKVSK